MGGGGGKGVSTLFLLVPPLAAHVAAEPRHFGIPSLRMDLLALCQIMHNGHNFKAEKVSGLRGAGVVHDVLVRPDVRSVLCVISRALLPAW